MKTSFLEWRLNPQPLRFNYAPDGGEGAGTGEGEHHEEEHKEEKPKTFEEFNLRFAAKRHSPHLTGGAPSQEDIDLAKKNAEAGKTIVDDNSGEIPDDETPEEKRAREAQERQRRRPGSNVPKIVEDKRKAESERDAARAEYEKYKTDTEARIQALQAKIDSGQLSATREAEYTKKISSLEESIQIEREELTKRNNELQSRLSLFDIQQDPNFEKQYIDPVKESFKLTADIIGADTDNQELLNRALIANAASLRANTAENRRAAIKERDTILSQIEESLPGFTGKRFSAAVSDYITATEKHAEALAKHEITASELREQAKNERNATFAKTVEAWNKTYDSTAKTYDDELSLTKEEKDAAKEIGIDIDEEVKKKGIIAKKAVSGQASMQDSIDLMHEGRLSPAYKARIKIQANKIAALETLVAKLRKGTTSGGTGGAGAGAGEKKETRQEWEQRNFGANRPGIARE